MPRVHVRTDTYRIWLLSASSSAVAEPGFPINRVLVLLAGCVLLLLGVSLAGHNHQNSQHPIPFPDTAKFSFPGTSVASAKMSCEPTVQEMPKTPLSNACKGFLKERENTDIERELSRVKSCFLAYYLHFLPSQLLLRIWSFTPLALPFTSEFPFPLCV